MPSIQYVSLVKCDMLKNSIKTLVEKLTKGKFSDRFDESTSVVL